MQERIEPPILLSRLMTFVMATALVVLVVLVFTLDKMFPLNRPQVFFLTSQKLDDKVVTLTEMPKDLEVYRRAFLMEYVRERNEITPDLAIMRAKWANSPDAVVRTHSTKSVFGKFWLTDMATIVRQNLDEPFEVTCDVEFPANHAVVEDANAKNQYVVSFAYICHYGANQDDTYLQNFKVRIKLESTAKNAVKWSNRMTNPLGLRVSSYEVLDEKGNPVPDADPLNWTRK